MIITNEIIEWCRVQHYNLFYGEVWLLYTALVCIAIGILFKEIKLPVEEKNLRIAAASFLYAAFFLIIGFLYFNI